LSVFRSAQHLSAQLIDDVRGVTLCAVHDTIVQAVPAEGQGTKVARAYAVGMQIAALAKKAGITTVTFDRAGYAYHGRVKAVADGARAGGLIF
jgi:large subunit ribosomal protein L18